jgi:hypothetical protein
MAGIIETKKPFDTGKALNEIRKMEYWKHDFFRC